MEKNLTNLDVNYNVVWDLLMKSNPISEVNGGMVESRNLGCYQIQSQ